MNIRHLEYFLEVVRQGSFSKAAAILHVTQPTISGMIKNLEDDLGAPLLYRDTKRLELTDAGQAVLEQSQQIVALFQSLAGQLEDITLLKKGTLRIGVPPITASTMFPRALGEFKQRYPNIQIQLHEFGSKKITQGINDGLLDIGIVCTLPENDDLFNVFPFIEDPLRIIVHPEHPLAKSLTVDFSALSGESFVQYSEDFSLGDKILHRCKQAGFQPIIICETSQREFMTQMVASKLGVALLPGKICDELNTDNIVSIPLAGPQIYLQLTIIWRKNRYLSFAARKWLEFATAEFTAPSTHLNAL